MPNDRIVLADRNYRFELGAGSRGARLNGTLLYLHYPPICDPEGKWFLHQLDMERSLKPYFDTDSLYPDPVRRIILDPGVGFAKSYAQNLEVIARLEELACLGFPVLLGTSRKSVIGKTLDLPADQRLEGTLVTTVYAVQKGCAFVRVHDVKENLRAIQMTKALMRG